MWIGLFWHRIALRKQSDGLYMSQDQCINRKCSSFIQQWHRQVHRSIPKLAHIQWTPTCFGQQCWPKHVGFRWMWANFRILLCTCVCHCSIQIVKNFVQKICCRYYEQLSDCQLSDKTLLILLQFNFSLPCSSLPGLSSTQFYYPRLFKKPHFTLGLK